MKTAMRLALIVTLLFLPTLAKADSVWTFTGELMDPGGWHGSFIKPNCNCSLSGVTLFDNSFDVLAYSWTDGISTLNQNNSSMTFSMLPVGSREYDGQLITAPLQSWSVDITTPGQIVYFYTNYDGPTEGATSMNRVGEAGGIFGWGQPNSGPTGVWTELFSTGRHDDPVSTPEPGSLLLLGAGLIAVALAISCAK
jgi:hypothetical protein